jgi:cell wall-associated NlpC family hydrolase
MLSAGRLLAGIGAFLLGAVLLAAMAATGATTITATAAACSLAPTNAAARLNDQGAQPPTAEQTANAGIILDVATGMRLPARAAIVAIATAKQESDLRNLRHGHLDSLGLFQQRPSQGWGNTPAGPHDTRTPAQRVLDPTYAATRFYERLIRIPRWQTMPLTDAAQAVQNSAAPHAYARWEPLATRIVAALAAEDCAQSVGASIPAWADDGSPGARAVQAALRWLGTPYAYGGGNYTGPTRGFCARGNGYSDGTCLAAKTIGFDCSGLTMHAWHQATRGAVRLAHHSGTQWTQGTRVPAGQLRAGDLVFFATNPADPDTIHHVGIYIAHGAMIHAPRTRKAIRLENIDQSNYWHSQFTGGIRPATNRVLSSA